MPWKRGDDPSRGAVARFAITSFVIFAMIGVGLVLFRSHDVRSREERAASSYANVMADNVIWPLFTRTDLDTPVTGARYDELAQTIQGIVDADPRIERIKVWNDEGMVVFSNDPEQVGTHPALEDDLHEAIEGELESEISDLDKAENAGERKIADKLFETYVPIMGDADGDAVAVVEVYQDYSLIQREIDRLTRTTVLTLVLGLLFLYAVLLPVVNRMVKRLRKQNAQLQDQAEQLSHHLELEQATVAELRELDRMKNDFVAAASHELRTPLTSIRGYADLLRRSEVASDPTVTQAAEVIERQSGRLLRLVRNLLRASGVEQSVAESRPTTVDLVSVVQQIQREFGESGSRIASEVGADVPNFVCVRDFLVEALENLVDNALKYSSVESPVHVGGRVEAESVAIFVRDHGQGVDPASGSALFDRFRQGDQSSTRSHNGMGLGLFIVKELVTAMNGRIEVTSEAGSGATFTIRLPLAETGVETDLAPASTGSVDA